MFEAINSGPALTFLLGHEKLGVRSENTIFTVLDWWLESRGQDWSEKTKQAVFDSIIEGGVLRFHHMDPSYLAGYAMRTTWMKDHSLTGQMLQAPLLYKAGFYPKNHGEIVPRDRVPPPPRPRYYYATSTTTSYKMENRIIPKEALSSLEVDGSTSWFIGLAMGLPICLTWTRETTSGGGGVDAGQDAASPRTTIGAYVSWSSGGVAPASIAGVDVISVISMRSTIESLPSNKSYRETSPSGYKEDRGHGTSDLFGAPWEDVVGQGSRYFDAKGGMRAIVTVSKP